jgi:creatinine amidohydrolase/Fe(II)-dependent formamide hydrolase-like protein
VRKREKAIAGGEGGAQTLSRPRTKRRARSNRAKRPRARRIGIKAKRTKRKATRVATVGARRVDKDGRAKQAMRATTKVATRVMTRAVKRAVKRAAKRGTETFQQEG